MQLESFCHSYFPRRVPGVILRICFGFYGVDWNRAAWRSGPRAEVMALQVQRARMGEAGLSEKVIVEIPRAILAAEPGT